MSKLFVYGTLLNNEVLNSLLGFMPAKHLALLRGYRCVEVKNQPFPAIYFDSGSVVNGELVEGLEGQHLTLLDEYEGVFYKRKIVEVVLVDGKVEECYTYVFRKRYHRFLTKESWSNDCFRNNHMSDYLEQLFESQGRR